MTYRLACSPNDAERGMAWAGRDNEGCGEVAEERVSLNGP